MERWCTNYKYVKKKKKNVVLIIIKYLRVTDIIFVAYKHNGISNILVYLLFSITQGWVLFKFNWNLSWFYVK